MTEEQKLAYTERLLLKVISGVVMREELADHLPAGLKEECVKYLRFGAMAGEGGK